SSRERRNPLAEAVPRGEAVTAALGLVQRQFVIPAPKIGTRRGKTGAQTPWLEQTIFVQRKKHGLRLLKLRLGESGRKLDISVTEFLQGPCLFAILLGPGAEGRRGQSGGFQKPTAGDRRMLCFTPHVAIAGASLGTRTDPAGRMISNRDPFPISL